jgi:bifunctional non-homologous end joining protein LigD
LTAVPLEEYQRKRNPKRTPEPFGGKRRGLEPIFVVQRHAARRLHYDLRLERNGALASWAVPKGIPLARGERHLAVHVEDHPLDYASFEGTIPAGEYGAGTVEIWDRGTYELLEEKRNGGLTVRLHGERLDGVWTLVPARLDGDVRNWLLLRKDDDGVSPRGGDYRPMLATSVDSVPKGDEWVFEVKWDGFRALAVVRGAAATLVSRNGNDLTSRFPSVARAVGQAARTPTGGLDGEVCALDEQGRPSFSVLQASAGQLVYYAFDILELDGEPVVDEPLDERRGLLERTLDTSIASVRISGTFEDGEGLLAAVSEQGLEGVVAKRVSSHYAVGRRTRDWLKVKTTGRQEFVIAGYTRGEGRRSQGFGSLVLAVNEGDELRWVGNVGTGFTDGEIERVLSRLRPLVREEAPFAEVPKMPKVRRDALVWVEPRLVAEVRFAEWTRDGRLRAPVYLGLRDDKPPSEVRRERPSLPTELRSGKRVLKLSNLDKVFWPDEGLTKGDLLSYYQGIAPVLVPHLKGRPFTMKRYPDGWQGKHFFQKDAPKHMPLWIPRAPFPASTREGERRVIDYAIVDHELALLWVVNMGCIDMHAWSSRADRPERPDWVLFDLDPSEGVGFVEAVEVALLVKEALDLVGLRGYPKTSGSRGIHILVPIARRHSYADVYGFASVVAGGLARAHPGLVTTEWTKRKRKGVLVDANQNGAGKTTASVYSVRPRQGASVSTPLRWEELTPALDPMAFTMDVVLERVARDGDLFAPVLEGGQSITDALRALGG